MDNRVPVACPPVQSSELADASISREQLRDKLARGEPFKLVMALNAWAFRAKHIPGSLHFDAPAQMFAALSPDDEIVVYCSNVGCHASVALLGVLRAAGYKNVRRYAGGLVDWEDAGLPLEGDWITGS